MRFVRYLVIGVAVLLIAAVVAALLAFYNQARLVQLVLGRIDRRTGYKIVIAGSRLSFNSHLDVILKRPRVFKDGAVLATLDDIKAVVSYHAILSARGLPLHALVLDHPRVHLPPTIPPVSGATLPGLTPAVIEKTTEVLRQLSDVALRFDLDGGQVFGHRGRMLVSDFDVSARRQHRHGGNWPWRLTFDGRFEPHPVAGLHVAGDLWLGRKVTSSPRVISKGHLWFWDLRVSRMELAGGVLISGAAAGGTSITLARDGELAGAGSLIFSGLTVAGKAVKAPLHLGSSTLAGKFDATPQKLTLSGLTLRQDQRLLASGAGSIISPYQPQRSAAFTVGGIRIPLGKLKVWLRSFRQIPQSLVAFANGLSTGEVTLAQADFASATPIQAWTLHTFRDSSRVSAAVTALGYTPPAATMIPPITHLDTQLTYNGGMLDLRQTSANIGESELEDLDLSCNLRKAPEIISYRMSANGEVKLDELYPLALHLMSKSARKKLRAIEYVRGEIPVGLAASGKLHRLKLSAPADYAAQLDVSHAEFAVRNTPGPIALETGMIGVRPREVTFNRVIAVPASAPTSGASLTVNGRLTLHTPLPLFHHFTLELHRLPAAQWAPLFVPPDQIGVDGKLGGALTINSEPARGGQPIIKGKLTMGRGKVQFGFLRSPLDVQSATLNLDGRGLKLTIPAAQLEGAPVSFDLTVPDLSHPALRIDASAQRLDFEVMRFIRLPWSPKTPTHFFPFPVTGHIAALRANFAKLRMANVSTDFTHDAVTWRVYNFKADSMQGRVRLDISGRAANDWINMKGRLIDMDAAALFLLSGARRDSPIAGRLYASANLWADTDADFFDTLAGTTAVYIRDGRLNKFTLLTRILSLIDLKNWLTAKVPDLSQTGIPFKSLTANFQGDKGDFYTQNLRLEGPVMDIAAQGDIAFGSGTMNMRIALIPFNTVNWLIKKIPVIGENLATGSSGLFAAYFQVSGPASDPHVRPKPITSVAEFVAKTLSLPINIIKPHTIKP